MKVVRTVLWKDEVYFIRSNDPTPSPQDINVTKRLVEIGELMGIEVLDHIIIGTEGYVSLREARYI